MDFRPSHGIGHERVATGQPVIDPCMRCFVCRVLVLVHCVAHVCFEQSFLEFHALLLLIILNFLVSRFIADRTTTPLPASLGSVQADKAYENAYPIDKYSPTTGPAPNTPVQDKYDTS